MLQSKFRSPVKRVLNVESSSIVQYWLGYMLKKKACQPGKSADETLTDIQNLNEERLYK